MTVRIVARPLARPFAKALALCCLTGAAGAQSPADAGSRAPRAVPEARGPMLGAILGVVNTSLEGDRGNEHFGPLFGARAGWGVSPSLSIRLNADISAVEVDSVGAQGIMHVDLVGRWVFIDARRRWAPYLEAGAAHRYVRVASYDDPRTGTPGQLDATGVGLVVGAGWQWWDAKHPSMPLDVGVQLAVGGITSRRFEWVADDGVETRAVSLRLVVGSSWYPMSRRYRR